jgi:hypothetical protein
MNVYVYQDDEGYVVSVAKLSNSFVEVELDGAEGKILVDRETLREALEEGGVVWCAWPDCGWSPPRDPHSGTCPFRELE